MSNDNAQTDADQKPAVGAPVERGVGRPVNEATKGDAMKDKHDGCERGFTVFSEAWYSKIQRAPDMLDEIMVGMYNPEGSTTGEFGVRWTMVGGEPTPRLEVFNDAWDALQKFGDMLTWMASVDSQNISPQAFAEALRGMGIKDLTQRANPYTSPGEREYASWVRA